MLVQIRKRADGSGIAAFGASCTTCARRPHCTDAKARRAVRIHAEEATLQRSRAPQYDFALLGAAHNLKRLARLGVHYDGMSWATA
jgi:hypothetical protein